MERTFKTTLINSEQVTGKNQKEILMAAFKKLPAETQRTVLEKYELQKKQKEENIPVTEPLQDVINLPDSLDEDTSVLENVEVAQYQKLLSELRQEEAELEALKREYAILMNEPYEEIIIEPAKTPEVIEPIITEEKVPEVVPASSTVAQPPVLTIPDTTPEKIQTVPEKEGVMDYDKVGIERENAKLAEQKEVVKTYFAKYPEADGKTLSKDTLVKTQNGEYVYEIQEHQDQTATIVLSESNSAHTYAITDYQYILRGFELENKPLSSNDTIEMVEAGSATKEGSNWVITKKPKIRFIHETENSTEIKEPVHEKNSLKDTPPQNRLPEDIEFIEIPNTYEEIDPELAIHEEERNHFENKYGQTKEQKEQQLKKLKSRFTGKWDDVFYPDTTIEEEAKREYLRFLEGNKTEITGKISELRKEAYLNKYSYENQINHLKGNIELSQNDISTYNDQIKQYSGDEDITNNLNLQIENREQAITKYKQSLAEEEVKFNLTKEEIAKLERELDYIQNIQKTLL